MNINETLESVLVSTFENDYLLDMRVVRDDPEYDAVAEIEKVFAVNEETDTFEEVPFDGLDDVEAYKLQRAADEKARGFAESYVGMLCESRAAV